MGDANMSQVVSTIATAVIAAIASVLVAYIQNARKSDLEKPSIILPPGVKLEKRSAFSIPLILLFLFMGGVIGYSVSGFFISRNMPLDSPSVAVDIHSLLPNITKGSGGIQKAVPWWGEYTRGGENGIYDPSASPGWEGCFGVAWNVDGFNEKVIVFQHERELIFQPGGWYTQICVPDSVNISSEDVGKIQADWLSKEYGVFWEVQTLP